MSKKLQNVKAVQQMIDGTHKFQTKKTIGFSDAKETAEKNKRHTVGDVWEETDSVTGITYVIEQKQGFRIKKLKSTEVLQEIREELRIFPNCRKETCTCLKAQRIDEKMRKIHGMCFDCVIEMEHDLRKQGKYEEYEQNKIRENALAWLALAERDVNLLRETYTRASEYVTNSEGQLETWAARMTPEEFDATIQEQFNKFKENFLKKLNGENNENN
jgi:hemerythrin-like domain-containing protein